MIHFKRHSLHGWPFFIFPDSIYKHQFRFTNHAVKVSWEDDPCITNYGMQLKAE